MENSKTVLVDINTIAKRLGVSVGLIRKLRYAGEIPYVSLSKSCLRFSIEDVDNWWKQKQKGGF